MRVAVLTFDHDLADLLTQALSAIGHTVQLSSAGAAFMPWPNDADLLMLDLRTGGAEPDALVRRYRDQGAGPVLLLAARDEQEHVLAALAAGADDYLLKPVRRGELQARVQILLERRYPGYRARQEIRFGEYTFMPDADRITAFGKEIAVTQKEFQVALLFFRNLGRPLSRATIRESVWSHDEELPSRTIDTHVSRVRSKLALRPVNGFRLLPVYSYGYKLEQLAAGTPHPETGS
jgi:DNA-binding response OmpR family regulator